MNLQITCDGPTRQSMGAVACCVIGLLTGIAICRVLPGADNVLCANHSFGISAGTIYLLVMAHWLTGGERGESYNPVTTICTFVATTFAGIWIVYSFFVGPGVGPFADDLWTVPNLLANVVFGFLVFGLVGAVFGLTYHSARRTYGATTALRRRLLLVFGLLCLVAFGADLIWCHLRFW